MNMTKLSLLTVKVIGSVMRLTTWTSKVSPDLIKIEEGTCTG